MKVKKNNKVALCQQFGLDASLPLFIFIGRLVEDKGVDLIPSVIEQVVNHSQYAMNCLMLGSGSYQFEQDLQGLANRFPGQVRMVTAYNEPLSHKMYASADFLLMPSRVEPCGLNQLYALRYGTIPIVRRTGGLQDTVTDIGEEGGFGICFQQANESDLFQAMNRALELYNQTANFKDCRARLMKINHSWEQSTKEYTELYQSI